MVGANRSERTFARKISYKVSQGADATTAATYTILKRIDQSILKATTRLHKAA